MTATLSNTMFTILDREFDIDELRDVVNHGMSAGVSGFIYYMSVMTSSTCTMMRFKTSL